MYAVLLLLLWFDGALLVRFSLRIFRALRFRLFRKGPYTRVMVVGGGAAGALAIREMQTSDKLSLLPVCVIDDDPALYHARVGGVPVVGDRADIAAMVTYYRVDRILVAMPAAGEETVSAICELCAATGCCV